MFNSLQIGNSTLELVLGDITEQHVDAIVNAANAQLAGGGGVDGAIHRRGGVAIMEETRRNYPSGCPTGSAVPTRAGNLPAKYVFHAVGPRWHGGRSGEVEALRSAYRRCMELAAEKKCDSIAFPSISTGAYGYPIDMAATIAVKTIADFLNEKPESGIKTVRICLFSGNDFKVYETALGKIKNPSNVENSTQNGYKNLSVYLIQGNDTVRREYVTLEEAMERQLLVIHETGNVGELSADNNSKHYIFIMSGDIVKGGRQDRTIADDTILKPRATKVPLHSFCVEQSRWHQRGHESAAQFASSKEMLSNRQLRRAARSERDQGRVWHEVAKYQYVASN
ncbi:MAG: O-acetyl-ADP-ribose deacetylase, partial [Planctomycetaceae bacterium]|nr:O-acetyl-ADP-ribose deacetylase [Planctomycetaceae bacterium]